MPGLGTGAVGRRAALAGGGAGAGLTVLTGGGAGGLRSGGGAG